MRKPKVLTDTAMLKKKFETDINTLTAKFEQKLAEQKSIIEQLEQSLLKEQSDKQQLQLSHNALSKTNEEHKSEIDSWKHTIEQYEVEVKAHENESLETNKQLKAENTSITEKFNCLQREYDALLEKYRKDEGMILESKSLRSKLLISETRLESLKKGAETTAKDKMTLLENNRLVQEELDKLKNELTQLKQTISRLENQASKDKRKIELLEDEKIKLSKHLKAIDKEKKKLTEEIIKQKKQVVISSRNAEISEAENSKNTKKIESLTKQLSDQEAYRKQSIKFIRDNEVKPINNKNIQLKKELDERENSLKTLKKQYEEYKSAKEVEDEKHKSQLGQLKDLQQDIDLLEADNNDLEKQLEKKRNEIAVLSAQAYDEYEALKNQHASESNEYLKTINDLEEKIVALQSKKPQKENHKELTAASIDIDGELTKVFNELESKVKTYEEKTAIQSNKIQLLEYDLELKQKTIDALQMSLNGKTQALTESDESIKTLYKEKEALSHELMELRYRFGL